MPHTNIYSPHSPKKCGPLKKEEKKRSYLYFYQHAMRESVSPICRISKVRIIKGFFLLQLHFPPCGVELTYTNNLGGT